MKRKSSKFELTIQLEKRRLGLSWEELSLSIGYNSGRNLNNAIIKGIIGDKTLVKLCQVLKLDLGKTFELKVKSNE